MEARAPPQARRRLHVRVGRGTSGSERLRAGAAEALSPETLDRRWAEAALAKALSRLQQEFASAGKGERFDTLKVYLLAEQEPASCTPILTARLGISEGAVKWAIHHLRQRYGELVRAKLPRRWLIRGRRKRNYAICWRH